MMSNSVRTTSSSRSRAPLRPRPPRRRSSGESPSPSGRMEATPSPSSRPSPTSMPGPLLPRVLRPTRRTWEPSTPTISSSPPPALVTRRSRTWMETGSTAAGAIAILTTRVTGRRTPPKVPKTLQWISTCRCLRMSPAMASPHARSTAMAPSHSPTPPRQRQRDSGT